MWEVARQRPVRTFRGHSQPVEDIAFSLDGRRLHTVSTDEQLLSWDVTGPDAFPPTTQFATNPADAYEALPSPDGRKVAYVSYRNEIQFRDVESRRLTPPRDFIIDPPTFWEPDWSADSKEFATTGGAVAVRGRGLTSTTSSCGTRRPGPRSTPSSVLEWTP